MPHLQKYSTLADIERLAEFAHFNQTDKAGYPYINHPRRVMQAVQTQGAAPYVQMAAILHDVTEDTAFTCQMLLELGVPEATVEIVSLLDRDRSLTIARELRVAVDREEWNNPDGVVETIAGKHDERYARFYYEQIKKNPGALMVKLADIHDNTQQWRLSYLPSAQQQKLKVKYAKALEILNG